MFESAVANVLNTVLGDYVANLESQQLNIGIWRGHVVLRNLNLRREALDKFHLPIDVLEGYLGELTLNIPWQNLKNRPIQIKIRDMYLLATPKSETKYNPAEEEEREYRGKMHNLQTAEMIVQRPLNATTNVDDKKEQTFITQLVTKITDNLQFSIENIHIRYEDRASNPKHPFAVGITLRELSAVSTDENWQEAFVHDGKGGIHKLLKLGSLAFYCDTDGKTFTDNPPVDRSRPFDEQVVDDDGVEDKHKYIMRPVSGIGRVILNKQFGGCTPKNDVRLLFDGLEFSINEVQYRDILDGAALFQLYARQAKYRKFHPPLDMTPKSNPREWLKFAGDAILYEVHDKQKRWSWAYMKERRDDRKEYIRFWSATQLERPLSHDEQKRLEALERKLSFDDLRLYRNIARSGIRKERALMAKKHEDHHRRSAVGSAVGAVSWIGGWLKGSSHHPGNTDDTGMPLAPSEMSEEQRQQLYDTIEYDEEAAEHAFDIPEETPITSIRAHLRKGALSILRGAEANFAPLVEIAFVDVATAFLKRPTSYCASIELGGMGIQDGVTEGTLYPFLVRDKDLPDGMPKSTAPLEWAETDIPIAPEAKLSPTSLFRMFYEHAPLGKKADDHLSIQARPLVITFNPTIIEPLRKFFQPPAGHLDSIAGLIEAAGTKFEGLKAQTRAGLEYALDKHRTLDLQIQIAAPILVFSENVTDPTSPVLVVDSGHVAVRSEFASAETKANAQELLASLTDNRAVTGSIGLMDAQLEKLLYDSFIVDLTSVQVLMGRSFTDCIDALHAAHATDVHVLEQTAITTQLQIAIIPDAVNLTKMKLSGHLPSLNVRLSDKNYKALMRMLDIFSPPAAEDSEIANDHAAHDTEMPYFVPRTSWFSDHSGVEGETEDEGDEFYDAREHADLVRKPAHKNPMQRLFEFKFVVDNLSVTLKKSVAEREYMDRVFADVTLKGFKLNLVNRPFDMTVNVVLRSLVVTDMSEPEDSEFRMLATSNPGVAEANSATAGQDNVGGTDLVTIAYLKVQKSHPGFNTEYGGVDTTIDAAFTVLQISVTTGSVLQLYDFFLSTIDRAPGSRSQHVFRIESSLQHRKRIFIAEESPEFSTKPTESLSNWGRAGLNLMNINIVMKPVVIRVPFRDALLAMGILNSGDERQTKTVVGTSAVQETSEADSGNILSSLENKQVQSNPAVVTVRESLKLDVEGLQLIMIDDLAGLNVPVIDMAVKRFDVDVSDWSSQLKAGTAIQLNVNYFNIKNSAWEPLIEPWEFILKVEKNRPMEGLAVDFYSSTLLNVNVTHYLIEMGLTTLHLWNNRHEKALPKARGQLAPYVFQNRTGYAVHMWPETANRKDVVVKTIPSGGDLKFRFEDWRTMRENAAGTRNRIGLQFDGVLWESIQNIPVDRESVRTFALRPKIDGVSHRLVVDIKLKEKVKYVILRSSLLIQNQTTVPLETTVVDNRGNMSPLANRIEPGEEAAVPIEAAYHHRLKVRPAGYGYAWSKEFVCWRNLISEDALTSVHCESYERPNSQFRFQIKGIPTGFSKSDPYPAMNIKFHPPIELENLLPYPMKYHIYDKNRGGSPFSAEMAKGAVSPVYFADMQHLLLIGVEIESKDFRPSVLAILNSPTDEFDVDHHITLKDPIGLKLQLGIDRFEIPDSGGAMKCSVYSPYVMLNQTGLDIFFKEKSLLQSTTIAAGQSARQRDEPATPFMFSFSNDLTLKRRVMVKVGDSEWSKPLSFEAVGSVTELNIPSSSKAEEIQLGVNVGVGKGRYSLTKIVTFTPRFIVKNNMSEEVLFREPGEIPGSSLKPSNPAPLHFLRMGQPRQLTLCFPGLNNQWSAPFNIAEIGKVHVKLYRSNGNDVQLVRVDVLLEGATIFILLNNTDEWPFRISNETDADVTFHQYVPHTRESPTTDAGREYRLPGKSMTHYSWDFPSMKRKLLVLKVNGRKREVNIAEIGQLEPLKYPTTKGYAVMAIDVCAEENVQVLRLSNYNELRSVYRPRRSLSSASIQSRESRETKDGFEVVDVDARTAFLFQIRLKGIGVSVTNQRVQELIYASMRGVEFTYRDTTIHTSVGLKVKWLQIDNQLYGGLDPIILYPTVVPRVGREAEMHPTLQAALVKSKDTSHGVDYYKYFSALLQELSVDVDEDFFFSLLEFLKFDVQGWSDPDVGYLCDDVLQLPQPSEPEHEAQLSYFEAFEIHPLKLNISFVRADRVNQEGGRQGHGNIVGFALNILTMAIGNINDAPIKLNALQLENLRASAPVLLKRIINHYSQEFFYQLHKVLGSVDVLGNPVGLFNTISSGISDIFYEPYQGFVSDRPQDFGIGLARGTTSFFKKTVYGVSDSFAKFTGSVGKGLSAATLDEAYQDQRRIARRKNRPKHVLGGVSAGAGALGKSAYSGLTGIITRPIEGAEQAGVGGFFKGMGKGIVGAIVKPAVGVFDLASAVTEGIKNTTTVFDENVIDRMRLPRFAGRDGILRPYSAHDALGLMWLKEMQNGRYFHEDYVAHIELRVEDKVAMLTYRRLMLFRSARLKVVWDVKFEELRSVKCQRNGISVVPRLGEPHLIPIADDSERSWFYWKIEKTIQEYNNAQRPLD